MRCDDPISEAPRGTATGRLDKGAIAGFFPGKFAYVFSTPLSAFPWPHGAKLHEEPNARVPEQALDPGEGRRPDLKRTGQAISIGYRPGGASQSPFNLCKERLECSSSLRVRRHLSLG